MEGLLTNQYCITGSLHLPQRGTISTEIKARTAHNKTCLVRGQRPLSPLPYSVQMQLAPGPGWSYCIMRFSGENIFSLQEKGVVCSLLMYWKGQDWAFWMWLFWTANLRVWKYSVTGGWVLQPHYSRDLWFPGKLIGYGYLAVWNCEHLGLLICFGFVSCVEANKSSNHRKTAPQVKRETLSILFVGCFL